MLAFLYLSPEFDIDLLKALKVFSKLTNWMIPHISMHSVD